ncbi:unnamed protein product [Camellia sinensis]
MLLSCGFGNDLHDASRERFLLCGWNESGKYTITMKMVPKRLPCSHFAQKEVRLTIAQVFPSGRGSL